ncbi:hypothetical protein ATE92_1499 [Ulvibacter sp. MAR_2010_11]|uniref:hypothetical protein n=1 Tax=Ulvibacter sp. MAR_2010_11 TaxID=1250229 RepID=UPI000C2CA76C|nr:hypothetical protein [Ulvibacter sp. MAR_2010_11]PKA83347.1 hypothetical protein ATE92_1499 [Ulvibacter sp. MAR_2010_11]
MKYLSLLFILVSQLLPGQTATKVTAIPLDADSFIGTDSYKNLYFIKDKVLKKQGEEGVFSFNDYQLGNITSVDIINPLKIVVFYQSVNTVVLLDNKLNEIERINFNHQANFMNISTATNAGNNQLWIFNMDTQQLELYNYRTQRKQLVSQPITGKLIAQASNFNYCFLLSEGKLRVFNVYGSLLNEMESSGFQKMAQHNENLVVSKGNDLFFISENSINPLKVQLTENMVKDLHLTQDLLYIYDGINIHTYSLTQPKQ